MAYRVKIAAPAERDLERAVAYIAEVLAAPSAAVSLLDEYERVLDLFPATRACSASTST
jgi:plasmid stabilization system protein ParE